MANILTMLKHGSDPSEITNIAYRTKGMNLDQVKEFVSCFNPVVKDQLLHPERQAIDAELHQDLWNGCQFDKAGQRGERFRSS